MLIYSLENDLNEQLTDSLAIIACCYRLVARLRHPGGFTYGQFFSALATWYATLEVETVHGNKLYSMGPLGEHTFLEVIELSEEQPEWAQNIPVFNCHFGS
jgi:hypothetical protein